MKRTWLAALGGPIVAVGVVALLSLGDTSRSARNIEANGDSLPLNEFGSPARVVARVNGKPVYDAAVDAIVAGTHGETDGDQALQFLVDRILLLWEGERLGLTPSQQEVTAAVRANRASIEEPGGEVARAALEAHLSKNSLGWEEYWASPGVNTVWRETVTISRARASIESAAKSHEGDFDAVEARLVPLRAEATIERMP